MFEHTGEHHAVSPAEQRLLTFMRRAEDMLGRDLSDQIGELERAIADGACVVEFVLETKARDTEKAVA